MTEKQFQEKVDSIYFNYCPMLPIGVKFDIVPAKFAERMATMEKEVMELKGIPEEKKKKAVDEIKQRILEFVENHNKQTDQNI